MAEEISQIEVGRICGHAAVGTPMNILLMEILDLGQVGS